MRSFIGIVLAMLLIVSIGYSQPEYRLPADTTLTLGLKVSFKDSCSAIGATIKYDTSMFSISELKPKGNFNVEPCTNFPTEGRLELAFSQFNCHQAKYRETLILVTFKLKIKFSALATYPKPGKFQIVEKYAKMCDKNLRGRSFDWSVIIEDLTNFIMEFEIIK
jgi:hypothetical protein